MRPSRTWEGVSAMAGLVVGLSGLAFAVCYLVWAMVILPTGYGLGLGACALLILLAGLMVRR